MIRNERSLQANRSRKSATGICLVCLDSGTPGWFVFEGGIAWIDCPQSANEMAPTCSLGRAEMPLVEPTRREPDWEWGSDPA